MNPITPTLESYAAELAGLIKPNEGLIIIINAD